MLVERYINHRDTGKQIGEIRKQYLLSDSTVLTLDKAINLVDTIVVLHTYNAIVLLKWLRRT
ncbi:hypothetical protein F0722_28495 [Bacillus anthracis]|nr:hypothetical protein [Bacillus anthracis]MXR05522.1 hypothetical protein [Bacillus anthracis]UKY29447.1 hypothetical protein KM395_28030 [Bacillus anthracis]HDR5443491.1 hypothetical protein [Bacillus anthracis]HDR5541550.1 hypothetical protein [Bacillus anthracis]HDR5559038.1 hypothetical protein [Bacillus anthracis]